MYDPGFQPSSRRPVRRRHAGLARRIAIVLVSLGVAAFACGGVVFGAIFVRQISAPATPVTNGAAPASLPTYSDPNRLTILLLGIDQRQDQAAQHVPSRSDTMIVLTVDPRQKKAALVSIPRDLVVPIPGHGDQKINTAHFWGEVDHPGGGPSLAVDTVERNFGIHVDYYARVDFLAFQRLIDAVGGIVVDVHRPILDDEYPTPDYGTIRLYIPTGPQWMDGARALEYARSRHSENDFARQARQREVILAAERKALQPGMLVKLPEFVAILHESVGTDIPLTKIPSLVSLARSIPAENVVDVGITSDMVVDVNHDGTVLLPDRARISRLFASVFGDVAPSQVVEPTSTPEPAARIEVTNGTTRDGLATLTADKLRRDGYVIAGVAQASRDDYLHTIVVDRTGSRHVGASIARTLGVSESAVEVEKAAPGAPDVTIILGYDATRP